MNIVFTSAHTHDTITQDIHRDYIAKIITEIRRLRRTKDIMSTELIVPMRDIDNNVHYPKITIKRTGYISYKDNDILYIYWM